MISPTPVLNAIPDNLTTFEVVNPCADAAVIVATPEIESYSSAFIFFESPSLSPIAVIVVIPVGKF